MHEASLMRDLMRRILELARTQSARRVVALHVRLGALCHMDAAHFREHFEHAAKGTIAEGATVHAVVENDIAAPHAADVMLESVELS